MLRTMIVMFGALLLLASAGADYVVTPYTACFMSPDVRIDQIVGLNDCTDDPCKARAGQKSSVRVLFTPNEETQDVVANIRGLPGNKNQSPKFTVFSNKKACDNIYYDDSDEKAGCPLVNGQAYEYKTDFIIPSSVGPGDYNIEVQMDTLMGDQGILNPFLCVSVPVVVSK